MHVARLFVGILVLCGLVGSSHAFAQTREKGPWWPSPHGAKDQAGNSNYITAEKVLKSLRIPKTGQAYELGRIYEAEMPQYGYRPYFLTIIPAATPVKEGTGVAQQDYFTGFIGQMGTQFDAFGHQGKTVRMADGTSRDCGKRGSATSSALATKMPMPATATPRAIRVNALTGFITVVFIPAV